MNALRLLLPLLLAVSADCARQDPAPVAVWTFNEGTEGFARDSAGRHDAVMREACAYAPSPGGRALVLNGESSFLEVKATPDLVVTDALTIDAWVQPATGGGPLQYLLDKGGERYSLRTDANGALGAGLKAEGTRTDVTAPAVRFGTWHRLTVVFARPNLTLYLDGKEVAQRTWDFAVGPGGPLYLGCQAGYANFFQGQIDELRLYRHARPPRPDDQPSTALPGGAAMPAKLTYREQADSVTVTVGDRSYEITREGVLRGVSSGGQAVMAGNNRPLLSAMLLQSEAADGHADYAPGQVVTATYTARPGQWHPSDAMFTSRFEGTLDFGQGDRLELIYGFTAHRDQDGLRLDVEVAPQGKFRHRYLRSLSVCLPLALDRRQRVYQGGDQGRTWETRNCYQYFLDPVGQFMPEPDHNLYRLFTIDQDTPSSYRLWRAESPATSPLVMQRGLAAPGWMAVADQRKGLLFAYTGFSSYAPKTLQVLAEGTGEALVHLQSPTHRALSLQAPVAAQVFTGGYGRRVAPSESRGTPSKHELLLLPFADEFRYARPDRLLTRGYGPNTPLASEGPAAADVPPLLRPRRSGQVPAPQELDTPLVSGGLPLARGALRDPARVRLWQGETAVPVQARALACWPDRSVKWLQVTFPGEATPPPLSGATGMGSRLAFEVSRRDGSKRPYVLEYGEGCSPGRPRLAVQAVAEADGVSIDTGALQLRLQKGPAWLSSARVEGRELLNAGGLRSFVDYLRTKDYPCGEANISGELDNGEFVPERLELEENGPLRATVRLEGLTTAREPARLVIRLEAYAGRECVRVFQSVVFRHQDPRTTFVRRMGLRLAGLPGQNPAGRLDLGEQGQTTTTAPRFGLRQHSHLAFETWDQRPGEHFTRTRGKGTHAYGWLGLTGSNGGLTLLLRNMWQEAPSELRGDLDGTLVADLYPESLPPLDLRRYSNYPHRSQGESAGTGSDWVQKQYYGQDPVVGIGKTHELLLCFSGRRAAEQLPNAALAADLAEPPLLWAGAKAYHDAGVLLPPYNLPGDPAYRRLDANMDHFVKFWLRQQRLWGWYGMLDYGDVQHYWRGGYGWIVPPETLRKLLAGGGGGPVTGGERVSDYAPQYDWASDNGRWGWGNTEGLPGLLMQTQYLRTGDRDLYFFLEAMARHVRDVDMRQEGKWLGYGTRHGVQHFSDGNHEERQTTHSEFRYYYYLSGDGRCRDLARLLYDGVYSRRPVSVHAAHSGRLQGLLTQWEMTGDPELGQLLQRYVSCFVTPRGLCEQPQVEFPGAKLLAAPEQDVNAGNMFFWNFGAGHGLLEYYYLTKDEALGRALVQTAEARLARQDIGLCWKAVAFAAQHAPEPAPYRQFLSDWAHSSRLQLSQIVPHNPEFQGGPRAMLRGGVSGDWFLMNDMFYVATALPGDPALPPEDRAAVERVDTKGGPPAPPPALSWQSEYDLPEFAEYLRVKHPQP